MSTDYQGRYLDILGKLENLMLAASGSAIAFALHETANRRISVSLWVIGVAILAWAASFIAGINRQQEFSNLLQGAGRKEHYDNLIGTGQVKISAERRAESEKKFNKNYEDTEKKAFIFLQIQKWGLVAGAVLYFCGHVIYLYEQQGVLITPTQRQIPDKPLAPRPSPPIHTPLSKRPANRCDPKIATCSASEIPQGPSHK